MENKKLIYFFGAFFSIVFAAIYILLFQTFLVSSKNTVTIYYQQVGLYKEQANAKQVIVNLQNKKIEAYLWKQQDTYAVVCGFTESKEENKKIENSLKEAQISFLSKQLQLQEEKQIHLWNSNQIQALLENLANENKTNEQTGTSS